MIRSICCLFVLMAVSKAVIHLPRYMTACSLSHNFTTCALANAKKAIPFLLNGDKTLGLPKFNPMDISIINVEGQNGFKIHLKDLKVYGLEETEPLKVVIDFKKKRAGILSTVPNLIVLGDYKIEGKIIIFDLNGHGKVNLTLTQGVYEYGFEWDTEFRNGIEYGKVVNSNFDYHLKEVHYHFENLIEGNKEMTDNINSVMNKNWEIINEDLRDSIKRTLLIIHDQIFKKIFTQIPLKELFLP